MCTKFTSFKVCFFAGVALIIWSLGGVISLLMGLVYCELATIIPQSGGDFTFIYKGVGAVPAFLTVWIGPLLTNSASTAVLALVFTDYFLAFMYGSCTPPQSLRKAIAALHIITIGISNVASSKFGVYVQVVCSVIKVLALALIIVGGVVFLVQGRTENFYDSFEGSATDATSYALALYSNMFAYGGYVRISDITEEIVDAQKNIPRAIVISVLLVTLIYISTNISYFVLIPKIEFLQSSAVAYDWAQRGIPVIAASIPICVMFSVYGANNGGSFTIARVMFAAARRDLFPEVFSYLHVDKSLPVFGILVYHFVSLIMLIPGDVGRLINFLSFMGFTIMLFSCIALLRLKFMLKNEKVDPLKFRTHVSIPILSFLFCLFLIIAPFITDPQIEFLYGAAFVLGGLVLYVPFIHFGFKLPGIDRFTQFLQLVCQICPTEKVE